MIAASQPLIPFFKWAHTPLRVLQIHHSRAVLCPTMAALRAVPVSALLASFHSQPLLHAPQLQPAITFFQQYKPIGALASLFSLGVPSFQLRIPSLSEVWESVLRAVPKKKTSHRKKRQRFLAGKGLKDVTEINKCPACGSIKKAHLLCPFCVRGMKAPSAANDGDANIVDQKLGICG